MKNFLLIVFGIYLFVFFSSKLYDCLNYTHITGKFKELRPYNKQIPVYFKGILIGKAKEVSHTSDLQHSLINIKIRKRNLKLPDNIEVYLKKIKKDNLDFDYLELILPQNPSNQNLKNGSVIKGVALVDFDEYMSNHQPDDLETIRRNLAESSANLNSTLEQLSTMFILLNDILEENKNNINEVNNNLVKTTENLNAITNKINSSIKQESLNNTLSNLENSTNNIENITQSLTYTTSDINKIFPNIENTMCEINSITNNANAISCGIRKTLRKKFGGLRLLFGKVIEE